MVLEARRGRLTEQETARFLRSISPLWISFDRTPDLAVVMTLARRRRPTVYDPAYLEVSPGDALPLVTLDRELARAAQAEQVVLIGAEIQ